MKYRILIPTYNEAENIERVVTEIMQRYDDLHVTVIDDNSPDGTADIVRTLSENFPRVSLLSRMGKEGLGKAYIHGFREAMNDPETTHVIMMDADLSHSPESLKDLVQASRTHSLVIGSRYIPQGKTVGWELWRRALSYFGNMYARTITRMPVRDMTGGFNCIDMSYLKAIDLDSVASSGYAFIMELKYALFKKGVKIAEVPITFTNRTGGESKISNHIIHEGVLAPWRMILRRQISPSSVLCPLCESRNTNFFTRKNNHSVYQCNACGFLFVYPLPTSVDVYDESYFSGAENGFGYVDYDTDKEPMIPTFEKYLDLITEHLSKKNKNSIKGLKLLDVGAATGFFMNLARNRGMYVTGVELSDYAASIGRARGLKIITGDLESAQLPSESYDVVTLCDVLEHVQNPKQFLAEVHRVLKRGGIVVINTPHAGSMVAQTLGRHWHLIVPPEHLHYFSAENLAKYLNQNGFDVTLNTTIGKRFTFQYIFKMLYKWQGFFLWKWFKKIFSWGFLARLYIPLNTHDNFFMIARKK